MGLEKFYLVDMVSNDGGNNMGGLKIGCITHFGVAIKGYI